MSVITHLGCEEFVPTLSSFVTLQDPFSFFLSPTWILSLGHVLFTISEKL